jgi:hypothetical protein
MAERSPGKTALAAVHRSTDALSGILDNVVMPTPAEIDARYMRGRQEELAGLSCPSLVSASV